MISLGQYEAQLNQIETILRRLDLLEGWRNTWRNPGGLAARFRSASYGDTWKYIYSQQLFDFRLKDFSLLQFRREPEGDQISYAYYDAPFHFISYEEFVGRELGVAPGEVGEAFREEYEDFIQAAPVRETVTPIRYDFDPGAYRHGVHPASHLHVGFDNQIRIGTRKLFLPLSFVLIVIRQCYPNDWCQLLDSPDSRTWCRLVREKLDDVPPQFIQERDNDEHVLV